MAQSIIEEIGQILPPSRNLAETLARAADYAAQQAHPEVTLEHLLLALTEDPDAALILTLSKVEIEQLKGDVSTHLGRLEDRSATAGAVGISANLRQILEAAAAAARGRRSAIDGAIVLAAIVGDGRSTAAHLLRAHGLTFEEAIKALQQAAETAEAEANAEAANADTSAIETAAPSYDAAAPTAAPGEAPQLAEHPLAAPGRHAAGATADEILATARQRVQGRFAQGLPQADDAAPSEEAAQSEISQTAQETLPAEPVEWQTAAVPGTEGPDRQAEAAPPDTNSYPAMEHEVTTPGPRPAPLAKRPRLPGAIRPAEPEHFPEASPTEPLAERQSHIDEGAIDEVLASIRKVGRAPADHQPSSDNLPPPAPQRAAVRTSPQPPPPVPSAAHPAGAPPASARPSDRDFFGPGTPGQRPSRGNAVAPAPQLPPPPPPPPGHYAGPPRAPLPGLPPTHGTPAPAYPAAAPRHQPPLQAPPVRAPAAPPVSARPGPPTGAPLPSAEAAGRQRSPGLSLGEMVENIPRVMRVGLPVLVEARIARAEVKALADGLQGGAAVWRHELTVTKAMSVRLRAPDGGFFIETSSPETQWIENTLGLITDDYASWRWSVTPNERGTKRLQLIISARTVGTDGLAAETALPDQIVSVKVRVNYARTARKIAGWALAAIVGGVLARFGEDLPVKLMSWLIR